MRVIFSRDRPAQLDLLLRSLERNVPAEETRVIWLATSAEFERGYDELVGEPPSDDFDGALRDVLGIAATRAGGFADPTVSFFCDDDVAFRAFPTDPRPFLLDERVLTVAPWLGRGNAKMALPDGFPLWEWGPLDRHDFGFPAALDGNVYRVSDVLRMIGGDVIPNPTMLETVLAMRLRVVAEERPLMACFGDQCVVGLAVNRVSEQSGVPFGRTFPATTEELNRRFLGGERIDLDALDFSGVDSCHHELPFAWEPRP